jgi:Bacteriocin-protection, YdeI or OmpD-Associated/Domain of unknown function (DUF1905)
MTTFRTTLMQNGNNVGIDVPEEVVLGFGAGKRVPVKVIVNVHSWRSTVAVMGGKYLVGVPKAHREAAGVAGGETHEVTLEHDTAERTVGVPDDLARALAEAGLRDRFDALAYSHRKEHVRAIEDAKSAATRERRIAKAIEKLAG